VYAELKAGAMSAAVYSHLDHALVVELPWKAFDPLGTIELATQALQNVSSRAGPDAPSRLFTVQMHLNATRLCAGSQIPVVLDSTRTTPVQLTSVRPYACPSLLHISFQGTLSAAGMSPAASYCLLDEAIREQQKWSQTGATFYTSNQTCTWQVSHSKEDALVNIVVDSSGMGPGAHLLVSEAPGAAVGDPELLAEYSGFSRSVRQDAVSNAQVVYVTFYADPGSQPAAGPIILARLANQDQKQVSPNVIGKVIYVGAGLLILCHIVAATYAWRSYKRRLAMRAEQEQQAARYATGQPIIHNEFLTRRPASESA
jgi:hypothetical protein